MIEFLKMVFEAIKDKIGRKQIVALATLGCLTYLISQGVTDLKPLSLVAGVGVTGFLSQLAIDWRFPRRGAAPPLPSGNGNGKE